jgi:DNA-binding NtrC family response regulator
VGSNKVDAVVDVRFVAATNRDPAAAVEEGELRSDLYYRLRVVPIRVPPLRERREDIEVLSNHFLRKYWQRDYGREPMPSFTDSATRALQAYGWPGNVRELQNIIEHTVVLTEPGAAIEPDDIPFVGDGEPSAGGTGGFRLTDVDSSEQYHVARDRVVADFERRYVTDLVNRAGGNMSEAARIAGVDRTTLYRLIEKHDLERDTILRAK